MKYEFDIENTYLTRRKTKLHVRRWNHTVTNTIAPHNLKRTKKSEKKKKRGIEYDHTRPKHIIDRFTKSRLILDETPTSRRKLKNQYRMTKEVENQTEKRRKMGKIEQAS